MKCYVVDAFAERVFEGNPAAVCVLPQWPPDALMQNIAMENNLSETAFAVKEGDAYGLRWFTPGGEIDLCGHATLAAGYVIMTFIEPERLTVDFQTMSGKLTVNKKNDLFEMDFPAYKLTAVPVTEHMQRAIGVVPKEAWMGRDLICVVEEEDTVRNLRVNLNAALELDGLLLHVTAKGKDYDCVSRTFAPKLALEEDPVCGSGHCHLVPLWASKLKKQKIVARQVSRRGGTLYCEQINDRVKLSGRAALYSIAELNIPPAHQG